MVRVVVEVGVGVGVGIVGFGRKQVVLAVGAVEAVEGFVGIVVEAVAEVGRS